MTQFQAKMPLQPEIQIRPMTLDDLDQVLAIDQLSFSLPWPRSAFRYELVENPLSLLYVAEISPTRPCHQSSAAAAPIAPPASPRVVATIVVWLILDEAHIATIAVHPDYRGQGLGGELLAVTLLEAIQRGSRSATLEVRAGNLPAQALYRRFKFEVAGRRPRYYRDNNEDALIMTREPLDEAYQEWLESRAWLKEERSRGTSAN
jgi:ribosomal-protein-alanine N-acetyltransferase